MLKKHLKTLLFTIFMLTLLTGGILSLFHFTKYSTKGITFTVEKNIDDKYGKLDNNTKLVIEKELTKAMEEKKVTYFFSYVYEDLNESYTNSLKSKDSVFIYYNENKEKLDTLSNIEITDYGLLKNNISSDELSDILPNYIETVNKGIKENSNYIFTKNLAEITCISVIITLILWVIFAALFPNYILTLKTYFKQLKSNAETKKELKELHQKAMADSDIFNDSDIPSNKAKVSKSKKNK